MAKADRIKELRERKGITQEELAKLLNTTKQTISKYEKGIVTNIPSDRIEMLCKVLDTTPAYLMGWNEDNMKALAEAAKEADHYEILTRYLSFREITLLELIKQNLSEEEVQDIIDYCRFKLQKKGCDFDEGSKE